jgi:hypothetical protein
MRYLWLTVMAPAVLAGCGPEGVAPSTGTYGIRGAQAAVTSDDARQAAARRHIAAFRTKLADRGVYPDRFEKFVARLPIDLQLEAVRMAAGELPGILGANPGTLEANLLAASRMTDLEKEEHTRSKGTK